MSEVENFLDAVVVPVTFFYQWTHWWGFRTHRDSIQHLVHIQKKNKRTNNEQEKNKVEEKEGGKNSFLYF